MLFRELAFSAVCSAVVAFPATLAAEASEFDWRYALVVLALIPFFKWLMDSQTKSAASRDQLLSDLIKTLTSNTDSLREAVDAFQERNKASEVRDAQIIQALQRMDVVLQQHPKTP